MRLDDRIAELIRKNGEVAMELYKRSRSSSFRITNEVYRWLDENGYIYRGDVRANVLDFFRNKVIFNGGSLIMKPV